MAGALARLAAAALWGILAGSMAWAQAEPPVAQPFALTLERRPDGVILEGDAHSEAERAAILEAGRALLPGLDVEARIGVLDGVQPDPDRLAAVRFAMVQIARLREGRVRIAGRDLSVEGEPMDRAGFAAVNLAVRAPDLPAGLSLARVSIRPPTVRPYGWSALRSGTNIVLQGYVPDEEARLANRTAAERLFAPLPVRDAQELAGGAPPGLAAAALAAMTALVRLEEGRAVLTDARLFVEGRAKDESAAEEARSILRANLPDGFGLADTIAHPEPPAVSAADPQPAERIPHVAAVAPSPHAAAQTPAAPSPAAEACLAEVRRTMGEGGITFRFGGDVLRADAVPRLRQVAAVLQACPEVALTVEGHTDSDGPAEQNLDLSHRRAQAVVAELIRRGVAAPRLAATGLGATRPLVPNDSLANKARNRRIEFVARP